MKKIFLILLSLAFLTACERKIDSFSVSSGSAKFTTYVAVGNSMFAGYADNALYHNGQVYSIPNLIAGQLQLAGSGAFVQPLVTSNYGVDLPAAFGFKLKLGYSTDCQNITSLAPVADLGPRDAVAPVGYSVNNFGVPGMKSFHALYPHYGDPAGLITGTANPYFVRFAQTPASSVLGDAMAKNPTFFTLWLGDNDVLSYALSGATRDSITSPAFFQQVMGGIITTLSSNNATGVIANIPDITTIPFFSTVPYNGLVLTRQTLCDSINHFMSTIFQLPEFANYHVGQNPFLVSDSTATNYFHVRQMVPGELVLLSVPQDSLKCAGWGIISRSYLIPYGIPKQFYLSTRDVQTIKAATTAYNAIISGLATNFNLGLVDMNTKLKELATGITWNGIKLNTEFVTGGAFSLDGVHLTPRGNAMAANFFIDAINKRFGSTIPFVDVTKYNGVIFP